MGWGLDLLPGPSPEGVRGDQKELRRTELGNAAGPNVSGWTAANGTESQVVWGRCSRSPMEGGGGDWGCVEGGGEMGTEGEVHFCG